MIFSVLKTRFHPGNFIEILYRDSTLIVKLLKKDERIKTLEERLNNQSSKFTDKGEYLRFVFECVQGCKYVIFQCSTEKQFCQFALINRTLVMDFPVSSTNNHFKFLKQTRKLLESLNFSFTENDLIPLTYKYRVEDSFHILNANFGSNTVMAADFVRKVFETIYKEDLSLLKVKLGVKN